MVYKKWKKMFDSIWKRERNTFIQFLLDAGLDVNALNKYGKTMLSYAAECGNLEIIEFLVQKGADGNVTNSDGSKPLHIAAKYGHQDIVKFFLNIGVFVDSCDNDNCTPLHYAAEKENIPVAARESYQELVHCLVNRNADLNVVNRNGCTPLLLAAQNSRKHIVELFIKLGTNVQCCDKDQWTVLHHSSANGWSGIVRSLVEGRYDIDLNAKNSAGNTPLIIAVNSLHIDIVKLLIESGANLESQGFRGETVLHWACKEGLLDVVISLVKKGCDLNAKDPTGNTPLLLAAKYSHINVVKCLIESGADVEFIHKNGANNRHKDKWGVLHYACYNGWLDVVKSLVNNGCNLNAKDPTGNTPLLLAAKYSHINVVKCLIESGADVECVIESGADVEFIHKNGANNRHKDKWGVLHYACYNGWLDVVKSLVNNGCNLNPKDSKGYTPMLVATYFLNSNVVECLIESGADVKVCDIFQWSVLHFACEKGWLAVVKSFIKKGYDLNAHANYRDTPLHIAVASHNLEIIKHLLKAGADCNVENVSGKTAFNEFIQNPFCLEVIELFIENGAYFQSDDYVAILENPMLKAGILQDVKLCTLAVVNKFNNADLPKIYKIPEVAERLPPTEKMKIANHSNVAQDIAHSAMYEIQTKGYCNVLNIFALSILSVRSLIKHYDSRPSLR